MKIFIYLATYSLLPLVAIAEPAKPAPKEFDSFQRVTGFHSHLDKSNGFEFRILEVDGSASVAMNPIYLYLVVTNNSSGDDLQSVIVELPQVSEVQSIRFSDQPGIIQIDAWVDIFNDTGKMQRKNSVTFIVSAPINDRKLPKIIDVSTKKK